MGKNQIHPKDEDKDDTSSINKTEQKHDSVISVNQQIEKLKLYPSHDMLQEDGGSNLPTKRRELLSNNNPNCLSNKQNMYDINSRNDNALLPPTCSSKHPGIMVEEMEKNMLQQEIARIDSMIL